MEGLGQGAGAGCVWEGSIFTQSWLEESCSRREALNDTCSVLFCSELHFLVAPRSCLKSILDKLYNLMSRVILGRLGRRTFRLSKSPHPNRELAR